MHLDTVMTMVRPDTFVAYPGVLEGLRAWTPLKLYRSTRFDSTATTLRLEPGVNAAG